MGIRKREDYVAGSNGGADRVNGNVNGDIYSVNLVDSDEEDDENDNGAEEPRKRKRPTYDNDDVIDNDDDDDDDDDDDEDSDEDNYYVEDSDSPIEIVMPSIFSARKVILQL